MRRIPRQVEKPRLLRFCSAAIEKRQRRLSLHHDAEAVVRHQMRRVGEGLPLKVVRGVILPQFTPEVFREAPAMRHVIGQESRAFAPALLRAVR